MAKIRVTPVPTSGIAPFEVEGKLKSKNFPVDGLIYYIGGRSYPAEIVDILDGEAEVIALNDMNC